MSAPKFGLDAAISRVASRMAKPTAPATAAPVPAHTIRFASYEQAAIELPTRGFVSVGSALYKQGHALWQLSKAADGYSLMRVASEPSTFEEDEVAEAPGPHSKEHLKMGTLDRYGVDIAPGSLVHYSLGGEPVSGHVVRASKGYLDVQLAGQIDSGVPSDLVMVDRSRRASIGDCSGSDCACRRANDEAEPAESESGPFDNESMGLHINPEKSAAFISEHFGSYGAVLATEMEKPIPRATIAGMNALAQVAKACDKCHGDGCEECMGRKATRASSWSSLNQFATREVIAGVCDSILSGVHARKVSKIAGIPFALAYALRDDIVAMPPAEARAVFATAKKIKTASVSDASFSALVQHVGADFASHLASNVLAFQRKALRFQRTAVDQTAEDYWQAYFGEYGGQWVREIKRRVKADLVKVALIKQGADATAAEYWSDYYGEYGDKLVDEVDRSTKKKKTVSAARMPSTPMQLPQPVAHRDIFAGAHIVADEAWEGNRVALAKTATGAFQVLIRSGNVQKASTQGNQQEAIEAFRKAVYAHCGI